MVIRCITIAFSMLLILPVYGQTNKSMLQNSIDIIDMETDNITVDLLEERYTPDYIDRAAAANQLKAHNAMRQEVARQLRFKMASRKLAASLPRIQQRLAELEGIEIRSKIISNYIRKNMGLPPIPLSGRGYHVIHKSEM